MGDWWRSSPSSRAETIGSAFEHSGRRRGARDLGEPIQVLNGHRLVDSGFYVDGNRIVDDEGREVTGERKAAAEAFLDAQRSGNIFDLGQQRAVPNPVGEAAPPHSIGQARDTVMRRGDPEPEERQPIFRPGDEQPRLTHMTNTENLTFDSQGRAVAEWRGRQITARDVERMSISDAAQAYRDIFGHRAPPNLSAKQALEQELRNARRPE